MRDVATSRGRRSDEKKCKTAKTADRAAHIIQDGTSSSRPQPLHAIGDIPDPAHEKYGRDAVLPRRALGLMLMPCEYRHIIRRGLPPSFVANASDEWSSANDDSIVTTKRSNAINTSTSI